MKNKDEGQDTEWIEEDENHSISGPVSEVVGTETST